MSYDPTARFEVTHEDVVYEKTESGPLLARIYRPTTAATTPCPALIDVHGGAWTLFDRTAGALYDSALAATGIVVVAVDFRQGPAHTHPAASADVARAVRFVRKNAPSLGVDPKRIGLCGSSSGGHLALLVAIKPGVPEHGGERDATHVHAVLALFPVSDPLARYRYALARREDPEPHRQQHAQGLIAATRAYFGDERAMEDASVPRCLAHGEAEVTPPLFVAQPELDQNVPRVMTESLVSAYRAAGGTVEYEVYAGQHHGFVHAPSEATDACIEHMRGFIARHLA